MKLHEILHIIEKKQYGCTKCDKMMEILIKMPTLHRVENTTCGCEKKKFLHFVMRNHYVAHIVIRISPQKSKFNLFYLHQILWNDIC